LETNSGTVCEESKYYFIKFRGDSSLSKLSAIIVPCAVRSKKVTSDND